MLTPKQEKFAQSIALDGMNKSDAYRSAYDTSKMTDKTVNEKASLLASQDKIKTRILELQKETVTPKVMSAQKRREKLSDLAENAEDPNVAMKAIDLLNKMTGEYVQKVEADVKQEFTINVELVDE
jgi:phage terminase small subunit